MSREELLAHAKAEYYPGVKFTLAHMTNNYYYTIIEEDKIDFINETDNMISVMRYGHMVNNEDGLTAVLYDKSKGWGKIVEAPTKEIDKIRQWLYE